MRPIAKYYAILGKTTFSPLDLSPALWLDASDTSTITASSGAVSEWRDKSGNARHVSQGTAASQPTTGTRTQNGLNVIDFDGGDILNATTAASVWTFLHDGTDYLVAAVVKNDSINLNQTVFSTSNSGPARGGFLRWLSNNTINHGVNSTVTVVNNNSATTFSTTALVMTLLADPDNASAQDRSRIFLNTQSAISNNAATGNPDSTAPGHPIAIGNRPTGGLPLDGFIAELIIVSGANASEANRVLLRDYLNAKWTVY